VTTFVHSATSALAVDADSMMTKMMADGHTTVFNIMAEFDIDVNLKLQRGVAWVVQGDNRGKATHGLLEVLRHLQTASAGSAVLNFCPLCRQKSCKCEWLQRGDCIAWG
jgi:hypothetical protein